MLHAPLSPLRLSVLAAVLLAACSEGGEGAGGDVPADEVVPQATPLPAPPEPLYDPDGRLLPSERVLGGLTLPRGLDNEQAGNHRHLFDARVPAAKLVQYFAPRLFTGHVEPHGAGASFINARPLRPTGTTYHMDVLITERGTNHSALIIRLVDVPTARPSAPTEEDLSEYHERLD
jgi:hypothetical protein